MVRPAWPCALLVAGVAAAAGAADPETLRRLSDVRAEIARLRAESDRLSGRERGLLGEVGKLDAELALRRAEAEEAGLRGAAAEGAIAERETALAQLTAARDRRLPEVARSLRALYQRGRGGLVEALLGSLPEAADRDGIRYASFLARRDAVRIASWRAATRRLDEERGALRAQKTELEGIREEADRARASLEGTIRQREAALSRIRTSLGQHERAIDELEAAAARLSEVVEGAGGHAPAAGIDVRALRGLLDWPVEGRVAVGFGPTVHPRFKTRVPHPGWDIEVAQGTPFHAVFEGRVAYAQTLPGYGLTVVIDHGHGVVSVYAHAGVLLVGAGDAIARGEELGRVGDTGSLRGASLYFEIRESGKPADPRGWLRAR